MSGKTTVGEMKDWVGPDSDVTLMLDEKDLVGPITDPQQKEWIELDRDWLYYDDPANYDISHLLVLKEEGYIEMIDGLPVLMESIVDDDNKDNQTEAVIAHTRKLTGEDFTQKEIVYAKDTTTYCCGSCGNKLKGRKVDLIKPCHKKCDIS